LHPRLSSLSYTWHRDRGAVGAQHPHGSEASGRWQSSPLRYMVENNQQMLRRRLAGRDAQIDFPILAELQAQGATDYLARLSRFARDDSPVGIPGMLTSWVSDRDGGFRDDDVDAILACIPALGLACYRIVLQTVANDLLVAYLGPNAGHRVLGGQVQRGSVSTLSAALMFADLRGFTAVADRTRANSWLRG
jgi:adenylate cyclase